MLFYGIEALVDAGVTEIGIIIAPETGDEIREAAGDGSAFGAEITYIVQDEPAGLAHAVLTAEEFIGGSPFVMYLGDNLLADGLRGLVSTFREREPDALILLTPVDDPQSYGVAELDGERIVRLIEKPKDPPSNLALVGVYLFAPAIFDAARALEPSWRGELEITEAIQGLIDDGQRGRSPRWSRGWWKDTGQLADMLEANRLVLEEIETADRGRGRRGLAGRGPGRDRGRARRLSGSVVRGPAVIGAGARIEDAYIGPYTSIGDGVRRSAAPRSSTRSSSPARVVEDLGTRMEASLLGREREADPQRRHAEDAAHAGRRQLRDRDHLMASDEGAGHRRGRDARPRRRARRRQRRPRRGRLRPHRARRHRRRRGRRRSSSSSGPTW